MHTIFLTNFLSSNSTRYVSFGSVLKKLIYYYEIQEMTDAILS